MQAPADVWGRLTADSRHVRRLGGTVPHPTHGVELKLYGDCWRPGRVSAPGWRSAHR